VIYEPHDIIRERLEVSSSRSDQTHELSGIIDEVAEIIDELHG
jgi:hypothetical protein